MRRIRELIASVSAAHPGDDFFAGVEQTLKVAPDARRQYEAYERALSVLDPESWAVLQAKAVAHFTDHRPGQRKQGFFNQLNDAFAYQYLVRRGYKQVRVLREVGKTQIGVLGRKQIRKAAISGSSLAPNPSMERD